MKPGLVAVMKSLFYSVWERTHPRQFVEEGETRSVGTAHHVQHEDRHDVNDDRLFFSVKESTHPRARGQGRLSNEDDSSDKLDEAMRRKEQEEHTLTVAGKRKGTESELPGLHTGVRTNKQNPNIAGACTTERMVLTEKMVTRESWSISRVVSMKTPRVSLSGCSHARW